MKAVEQLQRLPEELGLQGQQREKLAKFMLQLIHDVNNPLGAMGLEIANLSDGLEDAREAINPKKNGLDELMDDLSEMQEAIERGHAHASEIISKLEQTSQSWLGSED